MLYSTVLPVASLPISWMYECGLVHWNTRIVPLTLTSLVMSNIAKLWCASAGAATAVRARAVAQAVDLRMILSSAGYRGLAHIVANAMAFVIRENRLCSQSFERRLTKLAQR